MEKYKRFLQKHCRPVEEMTMREIKSLYNCLPTLITLFKKEPNIGDYIKLNPRNSDDLYISKDKIELHVLNLRRNTINNIMAHTGVCFEKKYNKYYPAHVYRIDFDTSSFIDSSPLDESFFEK